MCIRDRDPNTDASFIRTFANDPAELNACIGIPVVCDFNSDGSALLLLSSAQRPIAARIDIMHCESAAPSRTDPHPPIRFIENQSTSSTGSSESFQAVCDQVAKSRSVVLLRSGDPALDRDCHMSLAVPFFEGRQLTTILQLSF